MSGWNDYASGDGSWVSGENHAVAEQVVDSMVHELVLPVQWFAKFASSAHKDEGWYRLICAVCEETYRDFMKGEPIPPPGNCNLPESWRKRSHTWSNWNTARAYFFEDQTGAFSFAAFCEINDIDINVARATIRKQIEAGQGRRLTRRNHCVQRYKRPTSA